MVQLIGERYWCEASFYKFFQLPNYTPKGVCILCVSPNGPSTFGNIKTVHFVYPSIPGDISFHSKLKFSLLIGSRVG